MTSTPSTMDTKAYLYVVECADGSLYTGYTTDVERRIATHNKGKGAKYTRSRLPVRLLMSQTFPSKQEAQKAEAAFKKLTRSQKLQQIQNQQKEAGRHT